MAICKFFMQGHCKYGSSCRFEHPSGGNAGYAYSAQRQLFGGGGRGGGGGGGNRQSQYKWQSSDYNKTASPVTAQMSTNDVINTLISEITEWENNKMWPFSCVAFEKEAPCIPEFTDHSPEELRTAAYEALQSGGIQSYIQQVQTLSEEYKQKRSQVKQMTMTLKQKLISMIEDYRLNKNKSGASNSSSLFSKSNKSSFGATPFGSSGSVSSNPFANSGNSSNSPFGSSGTSPLGSTGASPFGANSPTAFGATSKTSTNAFGATPQTFGASGNSALGSSAFGSSNHAGSAGFSGSTFGTQTGTSPLNFGAPSNQTVSAFGQASSTPAAFSAAPQTHSGFGTSAFATQSQPTGLFGKPSTSPATNLFGSFSTQTSGASGFPAAASTNVFSSSGTPPSSFPSGGATASGFSSQGATASGSNGNSQKYTPLDQLTPEELEAFQAPTFTLGRIPTRPPPKELVF